MASAKFFLLSLVITSAVFVPTSAQLSANFYSYICPKALPTIAFLVKQAVFQERRMGASLLRMHFHDCFVNGCDASVLLDDNSTFTGEKTAFPNLNSLRGFEVIDKIKQKVDAICGRGKVSCADILAVAARDSVRFLGGPYYDVILGRRDGTTASLNDANNQLPPPFFNFTQLLANFQSHGLNLQDLIALSGAHTIGMARCGGFRTRIYNETNINRAFAISKQNICPVSGGDNNLSTLDSTTTIFDTSYFRNLLQFKGLLHSDQELFKGDKSDSDKLVTKYATHPNAFANDFKNSMIKMGNIKVLTGTQGQIRNNCRAVN